MSIDPTAPFDPHRVTPPSRPAGPRTPSTAQADPEREPPAQAEAVDGPDGSPDAAADPLAPFGAALPPPGLLRRLSVPPSGEGESAPPADTAAPSGRAGPATGRGTEVSGGQSELTEEEKREVEELRDRDRQVRQHEQAHLTAAGGYARGGPVYEYTTGPDNRRYATGGEVDIDTSEVPGDPQATIRKAQTVYRAALAPAEPSAQDRRVAAQARQMEMEAARKLDGSGGAEPGGPAAGDEPVEGDPGTGGGTAAELPVAGSDSGGGRVGERLDVVA